MLQILEATSYLHRHQIIHRDLKLGNVFLDKDWNVKVRQNHGYGEVDGTKFVRVVAGVIDQFQMSTNGALRPARGASCFAICFVDRVPPLHFWSARWEISG